MGYGKAVSNLTATFPDLYWALPPNQKSQKQEDKIENDQKVNFKGKGFPQKSNEGKESLPPPSYIL